MTIWIMAVLRERRWRRENQDQLPGLADGRPDGEAQ